MESKGRANVGKRESWCWGIDVLNREMGLFVSGVWDGWFGGEKRVKETKDALITIIIIIIIC